LKPVAENFGYYYQQHDTQPNDTQPNDTQPNDIQHHVIQYKGLYVTLSISDSQHE